MSGDVFVNGRQGGRIAPAMKCGRSESGSLDAL